MPFKNYLRIQLRQIGNYIGVPKIKEIKLINDVKKINNLDFNFKKL